jgi:hypothetical protein
MSDVNVVGCGVDTLVMNVCYVDKHFQLPSPCACSLAHLGARLHTTPITSQYDYSIVAICISSAKGSAGTFVCPFFLRTFPKGSMTYEPDEGVHFCHVHL